MPLNVFLGELGHRSTEMFGVDRSKETCRPNPIPNITLLEMEKLRYKLTNHFPLKLWLICCNKLCTIILSSAYGSITYLCYMKMKCQYYQNDHHFFEWYFHMRAGSTFHWTNSFTANCLFNTNPSLFGLWIDNLIQVKTGDRNCMPIVPPGPTLN